VTSSGCDVTRSRDNRYFSVTIFQNSGHVVYLDNIFWLFMFILLFY